MHFKRRDYKASQLLVINTLDDGSICVEWQMSDEDTGQIRILMNESELQKLISVSQSLPQLYDKKPFLVLSSTEGFVFYRGSRCPILGVELITNRYGDVWFTIYFSTGDALGSVRRRIMHHHVDSVRIEYLKESDPTCAYIELLEEWLYWDTKIKVLVSRRN